MWSFQRYGIEPDFVTLGKPMGNGHPVAAVITRREIAARFADETVFFSTFGGNPVSAAAALAVLDVLEDERVLPRVQAAGEALRAGIRDVASRHDAIGDVRGMGLAIGVEIVRDRELEDAGRRRRPPRSRRACATEACSSARPARPATSSRSGRRSPSPRPRSRSSPRPSKAR